MKARHLLPLAGALALCAWVALREGGGEITATAADGRTASLTVGVAAGEERDLRLRLRD
jgi:hypothetical protein